MYIYTCPENIYLSVCLSAAPETIIPPKVDSPVRSLGPLRGPRDRLRRTAIDDCTSQLTSVFMMTILGPGNQVVEMQTVAVVW
jgi:hypothetical protein